MKRTPAQRSDKAIAIGFLTYNFAPVVSKEVGLLGQPVQIVMGIFNFLANLAEFYGPAQYLALV